MLPINLTGELSPCYETLTVYANLHQNLHFSLLCSTFAEGKTVNPCILIPLNPPYLKQRLRNLRDRQCNHHIFLLFLLSDLLLSGAAKY